jgi:putative transposase
LEQIAKAVGSVVELDARLARQMQIHLCHRYTGAKLREIGSRFGIGESAVSQNSRRFSKKLKKDRQLRKAAKRVKKDLGLSSV